MTKGYDKQISEIEQNFEQIAYVVAMAISDGDKKNASEMYNHFVEILKNDVILFFLETSDIYNSYEKKLISMLDELGNYVELDLKSIVFLRTMNVFDSHLFGNNPEEKECEELYKERKEKYAKLGIAYNIFSKFYAANGIEGVKKLDSMVDNVNKQLFMRSAKSFFSSISEVLGFKLFVNKQFGKFNSTYGVKSLDDLLILNTEIDSFFVDEKFLNPEARKIIEENRRNFRKRIGAKDNYLISKWKAAKLKKQINRIYNFNLYTEIFNKTNLKDFFIKYGYNISSENLSTSLQLLYTIYSHASGLCSTWCNFGKGNKRVVFLSSNLALNGSIHDIQNAVIIHELIHSLEKINAKFKHDFPYKYRNINEAITEYLTKKSLKYLKKNILSLAKEDNLFDRYSSAYDPMMPLVDKLAQSDLWSYFLKAKFAGDIKGLENKIGLDNMKIISACFDEVYKFRDDATIEKALKQLDDILSNLKKQNANKVQ